MGDAKQPASTQTRSSQSLDLVKPKRSESLKPMRTLHVHCCCRLTPHIVTQCDLCCFHCSHSVAQSALSFCYYSWQFSFFLFCVFLILVLLELSSCEKRSSSPHSHHLPTHRGSSACWSLVSKIVTSSPYRYSPASFCRIISYLLFVQTSSTAFCFPHWKHRSLLSLLHCKT